MAWNSNCSINASSYYNTSHIVAISPASTNPRLTQQGFKTIFRVCGTDDQQGGVAAEFVVKTLKPKRVAIVHDKTTLRGFAGAVRVDVSFRPIREPLRGRGLLRWALASAGSRGPRFLLGGRQPHLAGYESLHRQPELAARTHEGGFAAKPMATSHTSSYERYYPSAGMPIDHWTSTMSLTLRPGEKIVWRWGHEGKFRCGQNMRNSNLLPYHLANGKLIYQPDLRSAASLHGVLAERNVKRLVVFATADRWHLLHECVSLAHYHNDPTNTPAQHLTHYFDGQRLHKINPAKGVQVAEDYRAKVIHAWDKNHVMAAN